MANIVLSTLDVVNIDAPTKPSVYTKQRDWNMEANKPRINTEECRGGSASSEKKVRDMGLNLRQPL
jgi:hypothetical protein